MNTETKIEDVNLNQELREYVHCFPDGDGVIAHCGYVMCDIPFTDSLEPPPEACPMCLAIWNERQAV